MFLSLFFFFKQKTAYEMRISDWSSDVCSSDLSPTRPPTPRRSADRPPDPRSRHTSESCSVPENCRSSRAADCRRPRYARSTGCAATTARPPTTRHSYLHSSKDAPCRPRAWSAARSEEHTSELQSLMRTSYAHVCLNTKHQLTHI